MFNRTSTYNRNLKVDTRQFNDANKQNKFFYIKNKKVQYKTTDVR